jgi:hypothetical protein
MPTIKFVAAAGVFNFKQLDPETGEPGLVVEDEASLRSLHGLTYSDEAFSEYLGDGGETRALADIGIQGGYLSFAFDVGAKRLLANTEYSAPRTLTGEELRLLKAYTMGQWSDGIGSNFFQERMSDGLAPQVLVADEGQVRVEQKS